MGRWTVKHFLNKGYRVTCFDNLSNGSIQNIQEFMSNDNFKFIEGDIIKENQISNAFRDVGLCIHLAAQINVQESLEHPERSYYNNVLGTYNVLEGCRKHEIKLVLVGTCMVYDMAEINKPISEGHPVMPRSPYAGSKLAAEDMALGHYHGYGMSVVILRPFNTYGPYQKSNMEGGVVSIFIERFLKGKTLQVYGDGSQTRDLLFVEDFADFIYRASEVDEAIGQVINAGSGKDISINDLAMMICGDEDMIEHVPHHHPQSEIQKLVCDYSKAKKILGWEPETSHKDGVSKTLEWIKNER